MKHIKHTLELYRLDWKRIFKHPIALGLVVALMILPSLYAWFNIKALWDPYQNTSDLPIAVFSTDKGAKIAGKEVDVGKKVMDNLHDNDQLGWRFVDSKKDLVEGVKSGKYFAGIYLPDNFSDDLVSFSTGEINKPKIEYYVNQKINAIAPKITDKGAASLQATITDEFIKTSSDTLVKVFNEAGVKLDDNLPSLRKIANLITTANDHKEEIGNYTQQVVELDKKLPEMKEKLDLANEFIDYLPEVDALTQKVVKLNDKFPQLKEQAKVILTLEEKIPEIEAAGTQLNQLDQDFGKIEQTLNEGIEEAKQGLVIIQQVHKMLPDVEKLLDNSADAIHLGQDAVTGLQEKLPENLDQVIDASVRVLQGVTLNVSQISKNLADLATNENQAELLKALRPMEKLVGYQIQTLKNLDDIFAFIEKLTGRLTPVRQIIQNAISNLTVLQTRLQQVITQVENGNMANVQSDLLAISEFANDIYQQLNGIDGKAITQQLKDALKKALETLDVADNLLTKAQGVELDKFLTATEKTVANAVTMLETYQKQMPAIKQEVHDANQLLQEHLPEIIEGIHLGADLYRDELPRLESQLQKAVTFIHEDWPGIEKDLTTTLNMVNDKFPGVEKALNMASDLIEKDWPEIEKGLTKAADVVDKVEANVDFGEVIRLLKLDANKESDFFMSPVELKTNALYPVPNNGSASTPFYTALCLWVGALLLSSVASTDIYLDTDEEKKKYSKREKFNARMLSFLTIAIFQAAIVVLGNYYLLKVYNVDKLLGFLFAEVVALTFMMIVYTLAALLGNLGKGIAIIILVLSISGGGGNYPIQLSGKFFQMINPILPFTHAVNLLRESMGGIYWPNATHALWILGGLFFGFWILGSLLYPKVSQLSKKLAEWSHKAHFFH